MQHIQYVHSSQGPLLRTDIRPDGAHRLPPRSPLRATLNSKRPPPARESLKGRSLSLGARPRSREDSAPDRNPRETNLGVLELSSTAKRPTSPGKSHVSF
ncbi:hypothetical protein BS47DRAFT_1351871 [Hydnum rufescens UP504]|uniref:Uncharacterized protein n=1 Tax=Hydnum rufescens UP504 TaxID=1448309 RepID=A0A9P6AK74_9AGAM|nr:hypothetical protein BS47DRAFT_1351871 [Hydnum rufescens UP504]